MCNEYSTYLLICSYVSAIHYGYSLANSIPHSSSKCLRLKPFETAGQPSLESVTFVGKDQAMADTLFFLVKLIGARPPSTFQNISHISTTFPLKNIFTATGIYLLLKECHNLGQLCKLTTSKTFSTKYNNDIAIYPHVPLSTI